MLEWLQTILEGAKVEDGKLDVTAVNERSEVGIS